ncbi:MAG: hypothetical protein ACLTMP_05645 [Eggerthella lenta]
MRIQAASSPTRGHVLVDGRYRRAGATAARSRRPRYPPQDIEPYPNLAAEFLDYGILGGYGRQARAPPPG